MELLEVNMRQGLTQSAYRRKSSAGKLVLTWSRHLVAALLVALSFFLSAPLTSGAPQKEASNTPSASQQAPKAPAAAQKPNPQRKGTFRIRISNELPMPMISIRANEAKLAAVTTELSRQLQVPIVLSPLMKTQDVTLDFKDMPLEVVARLLSPQPIADYVVTGGAGTVPSQKKTLAIYLQAYNEPLPARGLVTAHAAGGGMHVIYIAETEDEEKQIQERRKQLEVSVAGNALTVKAPKQPLYEVLQVIAAQMQIPFAILNTEISNEELSKPVDWNIKSTTLEDIAQTWFPETVRVYLRADLAANESRAIRITMGERSDAPGEKRSQKAS